jgi:hypothetical protein
MRELFAKDPKRGKRLAAEAAGVYLDYSKTASPMTRSICYCNSPKKRTVRGPIRCLAAKRIYHADRADLIWLPQHVDAFPESSIS